MIFQLNKSQLLSDQTDEQLIADYNVTGNAELIGELFNRYAHLVYGICLKYIKHKEDSKDIAMNIYEKLLANPPSEDILLFKNWLYIITRNHCLTYLRSLDKKVDEVADWEDLEKKSKNFMENEHFLSPNSEVADDKRILAALALLKPDQRKCLELFFYKNMSYKEIEKKTKYTALEIKSFLQNGKRNLKLILESEQLNVSK